MNAKPQRKETQVHLVVLRCFLGTTAQAGARDDADAVSNAFGGGASDAMLAFYLGLTEGMDESEALIAIDIDIPSQRVSQAI